MFVCVYGNTRKNSGMKSKKIAPLLRHTLECMYTMCKALKERVSWKLEEKFVTIFMLKHFLFFISFFLPFNFALLCDIKNVFKLLWMTVEKEMGFLQNIHPIQKNNKGVWTTGLRMSMKIKPMIGIYHYHIMPTTPPRYDFEGSVQPKKQSNRKCAKKGTRCSYWEKC